jgi:hypothetical protein
MLASENKTCGECAYWKTPKCTFSGDHAILRKGDSACGDFYERQKPKDKEKKKQFKDSGISPAGPFEAIYHNEKPCFMVENNGSFSILETLEIERQVLYPKEAKQIPYEPYGYFEGSVPNREDLFSKVYQEINTFIDVEPIWKDVLSASVLLSYHQEKLQTTPYIFLYGDNESGKSTVL